MRVWEAGPPVKTCDPPWRLSFGRRRTPRSHPRSGPVAAQAQATVTQRGRGRREGHATLADLPQTAGARTIGPSDHHRPIQRLSPSASVRSEDPSEIAICPSFDGRLCQSHMQSHVALSPDRGMQLLCVTRRMLIQTPVALISPRCTRTYLASEPRSCPDRPAGLPHPDESQAEQAVATMA